MTAKLLVTTTGALLAFGVLVFWQGRQAGVAEAVNAPPITRGDPAAARKLVSVLSPTCSHCAEHELQSGELLERAAADGDLYHAVYPVTTTGGAERYTYGFLCAARQGAFRAYAEAHYEAYFRQGGRPDAAATARAVGLEVVTFRRCVASPEVAEEAEHSLSWAKMIGAAGTPTFFVYRPESDRWQRLGGRQRLASWKRWLGSEELGSL